MPTFIYASQLLGKQLSGGWSVIEALPHKVNSTGGNFSCTYKVRNEEGALAFLKAMDFTDTIGASDMMAQIYKKTSEILFEINVVDICKNLKRVVTAITHGQIVLDKSKQLESVVFYIIFELAEGDSRDFVTSVNQLELVWIFRTLHSIAVGIRQLHGENIAHQDLKPSNVLLFQNNVSKIGDLGRASHKSIPSLHDVNYCAGDLFYAPPELLYNYIHPEWQIRRERCDLYLLGSMIVFFATGQGFTQHLLLRLSDSLKPATLGGQYRGDYSDIRPFLETHYEEIVDQTVGSFHDAYRMDVRELVSKLCHPNPERRGYEFVTGDSSRRSLERCISVLDRLSRKAQIHAF